MTVAEQVKQEIQNRRPNQRYSPAVKKSVKDLRKLGRTFLQISRELDIPFNSVATILKRKYRSKKTVKAEAPKVAKKTVKASDSHAIFDLLAELVAQRVEDKIYGRITARLTGKEA